jgi:hypothetical protein
VELGFERDIGNIEEAAVDGDGRAHQGERLEIVQIVVREWLHHGRHSKADHQEEDCR